MWAASLDLFSKPDYLLKFIIRVPELIDAKNPLSNSPSTKSFLPKIYKSRLPMALSL